MFFLTGEIVLEENIELTIVSTMPPHFILNCVTSGGPVAISYWKRNGVELNTSNNSFTKSSNIVDFVDAVYNHTLIVHGNYPGIYAFEALNPFSSNGSGSIRTSQNVNGMSKTSVGKPLGRATVYLMFVTLCRNIYL